MSSEEDKVKEQPKLKLYKVSPKTHVLLSEWDYYDEMIVWASCEKEAILYHPHGGYKWDSIKRGWYWKSSKLNISSGEWVDEPSLECLEVTLVRPDKPGLVLASFRAG